MKSDKDCSLKFLLDMCKITYTETQLMKLKRYLSILYVVRKCSVRLEKTLTVPKVKSLVIPNIVTKTGSKQKQPDFCLEYTEHEDEMPLFDISNSEDENWMPENSVQLSDSERESSREMSNSEHYKNSPKKQKLDTEISNLSLPRKLQENLFPRLIKTAKKTEPGVINVSFSNQKDRPYANNTEFITSHELDAETMPKNPVSSGVKLSFPSVSTKAVKKHLSNEKKTVEQTLQEKYKYKCDKCCIYYDCAQKLNMHICMCQNCDKTFATSEAFKKHIISHYKVYESVFPFMCDKCCKTFSSWDEWNNHFKIAHQKEENKQRQALLCDKCFECFESEELLNLHIKASHQKGSVSTFKIYKDIF